MTPDYKKKGHFIPSSSAHDPEHTEITFCDQCCLEKNAGQRLGTSFGRKIRPRKYRMTNWAVHKHNFNCVELTHVEIGVSRPDSAKLVYIKVPNLNVANEKGKIGLDGTRQIQLYPINTKIKELKSRRNFETIKTEM